MDKTLQRLLSRLDKNLLAHLQAHCVEQAARIDELEAQNARLENELADAERCADMWHGLAFEMAADPDVQIGITQEGELVIVAEGETVETALADQAEEDHAKAPALLVLRTHKDERWPTAGNFLLDDRLDGRQTADVGCLDAPDFQPAGSHRANVSPVAGEYTYVQPTLSMRGSWL